MTVRNLDKLFHPRSIAVIGASNRDGSVGALVMRNLLQGGFQGPILPVNPHHRAVAGVLCYPSVEDLPLGPELAVVATPPQTVPGLIHALGARGTRAAIVLTAGLSRQTDGGGRPLRQAMLENARPHLLRILGPNCLGLLVPGIGLNASFAHCPAEHGHIAFVSQSAALSTAVLDWAAARGIGFSHFVSLGDVTDVDFGDTVDYLATDPKTRAILLYIEAITDGRKFMSACRAAARNKPVLVIKSGRVSQAAAAAQSHTGAVAGADEVYDAAFRRAGLLRVGDVDELFAAVETLARARSQKGDRLAVLTNGGGIGVMAADDLIRGGGRLAELGEETIAALDRHLPPTWSRGNPVDIVGDAPGSRYADAIEILLSSKEADALLVMHAPTAMADSTEAAEAVIDVAKKHKTSNILTSWVGAERVAEGRRLFQEAGLPTYDTPGQAVGAFMHMVRFRRNQEMLMETPPSAPQEFKPATATARTVVENRLATGSDMMSEPEAKAVLAAYGIPTVETHVVSAPEDAAAKAAELGFPVALKVLSDDIPHKSDVGGVDLFLDSEDAVLSAAQRMTEACAKRAPNARLQGFTVQQMALRPAAHEIIVGIANDPVFGPAILFGHGGTAVEVIGDRAVALPPLNMNLARDLISRTRIYRLLEGYRHLPAADLDKLCLTLMQVSQLVIDIPEIVELDINPLLVDDDGVLALDTRIRVSPATRNGYSRLAIRPYPQQLEEPYELADGRKVVIRPIRPEDEPEHYAFLSRLTPEDVRFRFFGQVGELPHSQMARLTQIDYDREMAFIAQRRDEHGRVETLGVVRTVTDPDNEQTEFAIVVRSDLKSQGLGRKLLEKMIAYCRARGTRTMIGQVLADNSTMLGLVDRLGFEKKLLRDEGAYGVRLTLTG